MKIFGSEQFPSITSTSPAKIGSTSIYLIKGKFSINKSDMNA